MYFGLLEQGLEGQTLSPFKSMAESIRRRSVKLMKKAVGSKEEDQGEYA